MTLFLIFITLLMLFTSQYVQSATHEILIKAGLDFFDKRSNELNLQAKASSGSLYSTDIADLKHHGWAQALADKKLWEDRPKMKKLKSSCLMQICEGTWAILFPAQSGSVLEKIDGASFQVFLKRIWTADNDHLLENDLHGVGIASTWTVADVGKAGEGFLVITFFRGTAILYIFWMKFSQVKLNQFLMADAHTFIRGKVNEPNDVLEYTFLSYSTGLKKFDYDAILGWIWKQTQFPFGNAKLQRRIKKYLQNPDLSYGFTIYNGGSTIKVDVCIGIYVATGKHAYNAPYLPKNSKDSGPQLDIGNKNMDRSIGKDLADSDKETEVKRNQPQIIKRNLQAIDEVPIVSCSARAPEIKNPRLTKEAVATPDGPTNEEKYSVPAVCDAIGLLKLVGEYAWHELPQIEAYVVARINCVRAAKGGSTQKLLQCVSGLSKMLTEEQASFLAYPSRQSNTNPTEPFHLYIENQGKLPGPECKLMVASFSFEIRAFSNLCDEIMKNLEGVDEETIKSSFVGFDMLDVAVNQMALTVTISEDSQNLVVAIVLVKNKSSKNL